ncbi:MAG: hypothetical protein M3N18_04540 [Actinomycetota bacterium]|nr:hypothetical protein [Actinomycetota bacterium]
MEGRPRESAGSTGRRIDAVEAWGPGDLVHPFERFARLDHDEARHLRFEDLGAAGADDTGRADGAVGAEAARRVAAGRHGALGVCGAVHEGHDHDGPRPGVEGFYDHSRVVTGEHAGDRGGPAGV